MKNQVFFYNRHTHDDKRLLFFDPLSISRSTFRHPDDYGNLFQYSTIG